MKLNIKLYLGLVLVVMLTGCTTFRSIRGPAAPPTIETPKFQFDYVNKNEPNYFRTVYQDALNLETSELANCRVVTNIFTNLIVVTTLTTNVTTNLITTVSQSSSSQISFETNIISGSSYLAKVYRFQTDKHERARLVRNDIILELQGVINRNYAAYEVALRDDRNTKDLVANLSAMALTAAATAAGTEASKTILAAIATGVLGANAETDKQLFHNFTVEALSSQMQALRAEQETNLLSKLKSSVSDYPLNMALDDLGKFYEAGFVTRALQAIISDTGEKAKRTQDSVKEVQARITGALQNAAIDRENIAKQEEKTSKAEELLELQKIKTITAKQATELIEKK